MALLTQPVRIALVTPKAPLTRTIAASPRRTASGLQPIAATIRSGGNDPAAGIKPFIHDISIANRPLTSPPEMVLWK